MTTVITTPMGNIGHQVVSALLKTEEPLRVIARNPHKLSEDMQGRVEVIQGSTDDADVLIQALNGADALFWCIPQSHTQDNVLDYYLQFTQAAAIALQHSPSSRVVTVSSGGKGLAQNAGAISALHRMEDLLNETGVPIRHLRCGNFMENFLWQTGAIAHQQTFYYPLPGDYPIPLVATGDIAAIAAQWLTDHDGSGQAGIAVHGAEDLSMHQSAEIFSQVLGKPIRFQQVSPNDYYDSLLKHGASAAFAQSLVDLFTEVADGIYQAESRTPKTTTPTTLEQWTTEVMLPAIVK
ncbi:MAG TPA: NmrA family NAD(P)-binding protein [Coleofasciculaceae cyanobacterium]